MNSGQQASCTHTPDHGKVERGNEYKKKLNKWHSSSPISAPALSLSALPPCCTRGWHFDDGVFLGPADQIIKLATVEAVCLFVTTHRKLPPYGPFPPVYFAFCIIINLCSRGLLPLLLLFFCEIGTSHCFSLLVSPAALLFLLLETQPLLICQGLMTSGLVFIWAFGVGRAWASGSVAVDS